MTEAEMDAADPKDLAAKVKNATDILYQVIKHFVYHIFRIALTGMCIHKMRINENYQNS